MVTYIQNPCFFVLIIQFICLYMYRSLMPFKAKLRDHWVKKNKKLVRKVRTACFCCCCFVGDVYI